MGGNRIDRAVRAQAGRLLDVDFHAPGQGPLTGEQGGLAEVLFAQHGQVVAGTRHDRRNDHLVDRVEFETFERKELEQPDGIFVCRAARIRGDAPATAHLHAVHQGEDDVGVTDIAGEQHQSFSRRITSPA